jgi:hypothetical protein
MLRRILLLAVIAVALAIGAGVPAQAAAQKACALLTADDVAAVLGDTVTWSSAQAGGSDDGTSCSYTTKVRGSDAAQLSLAGGRANFDANIRQLQDQSKQYHLPPLTALSGVGDAAFLTAGQGSSGPVPAQVFVMKGDTYFYVALFCKPAQCASQGTALARRIADRIKGK